MNGWTKLLGLALVLATALPAFAIEKGLYLVDGTNDYFFVDTGGTRHVVRDFDSVKSRWFADMPVIKTRMEVLQELPTGDVITESVGPDMVVKKTTVTTKTTEATHLDSGVYEIEGSSDHYYIDGTGRRHLINGWDTLRPRFFSSAPIHKTRLELIDRIPTGEVITETTAPQVIQTKTTTTTEESVR